MIIHHDPQGNAVAPGRLQIGMVAGFTSEQRPASDRNPRPASSEYALSPEDGEQGMPKSWHRGTWQRRRVAATDLTAGPAALRAVLVRTPPSGSDWLPEVKLDG